MNWISVKDRLPQPGTYVLVYNAVDYTKCVWFSLYSAKGYNQDKQIHLYPDCCWQLSHSYTVTHWAPLPECPQE